MIELKTEEQRIEMIKIAKTDEEYKILIEKYGNIYKLSSTGKLMQSFDGISFFLYKGSRYFINKRTPMHKYVWNFYNGSIPKGYHVHHKDENSYNNDISNLELLPGDEHCKMHMKKRVSENMHWFKNVYERTKEGRKKWDESPEGKEAKRINNIKKNKILWDNMPIRETKCIQCGIVFKHKTIQKVKFCTNKCRKRYRTVNKIGGVAKKCIRCKKDFVTLQKNNLGFCSQRCWRLNKNGK